MLFEKTLGARGRGEEVCSTLGDTGKHVCGLASRQVLTCLLRMVQVFFVTSKWTMRIQIIVLEILIP